MRRHLFPYPFLFIFLISFWILLSNFTLGEFLLGIIVSFISCQAMLYLKQEKVYPRNFHLFLKLIGRVFIDIFFSNLSVAHIVLTRGRKKHPDGFVIIPLDLKSRMGIAVLAVIIMATPGTAWIAYNGSKNEILLHVLDLKNDFSLQTMIKKRYEALLLEIF